MAQNPEYHQQQVADVIITIIIALKVLTPWWQHIM
jgi:hypothetical protein